MQQASRQGVYAQTAAGLVEISHYGSFSVDGMSQAIEFKFNSSIPQVAGAKAFVTNIPEAVMSDAKVYLLNRMEEGQWHRGFTGPSDTKPVSAAVDHVSGSIYVVTPDLPSGAGGFLCLWVKMPEGSLDRMYAVQLK